MKKFCFKAFTMAEILLSLTIIGVVAAITLPSLMGNINERTWNTQRKALHARMSQAIGMMPQLNGYGTLRQSSGTEGTASYDAGEDTAAEAFVTEGLSKVLKINNICDADNLEDCGLSSTVYNMNGGVAYSAIPKQISDYMNYFYSNGQMSDVASAKPAAFETQNGESILMYYNPYCTNAPSEWYEEVVDSRFCANFIYDLNGNKGPNTVGKDIGVILALYPVDSSVVAPMPRGRLDVSGVALNEANTYCRNNLSDTTRMPNLEEAIALALNEKMFPSAMSGVAVVISSTSTRGNKGSYPNGTGVYGVSNMFGSGFAVLDADKSTSSDLQIYCVER